jgi:beta-glucanase (GH16 family)
MTSRLFPWALTLGCACMWIAGKVNGQESRAPDKYELQWSDDFHGSVLDASKWNYRTDVKAFTAQTPANISLDGAGHMNISLRQEEYAGRHFTGGGIVSKVDFRYGYYEVEAKTTQYPGWHTAFWMLAGDGRTIPPKFPAVSDTSTEIDDFEIEDPSIVSMGTLEWLHGQNNGNTRCDRHYVPGFSTAAAYHVYGLEWTEEEVKYYLDGKVICTQQYPPTQTPHDRLNIWLTAIGYKSGVTIRDQSAPADIGLAVGKQPSPASFGRVAYYIRD